ncbi:MAG: thioredoxin family protein [Flavobacteriaceae bacterium]|nr:thioredoxin family protein [Flavobacteriaceae bacterium]|tara:strand:- start:13 stop:618 length:606 start_codon:yes stop_codon:yes gene_type:complete
MKIILFAYSLLFLSTPTDLVNGDGYKIGDVATDFSLLNVDGEMVSLADFEDAKGFILIFTCNTCPYSVAYEDRIIALDKAYKSKGYPVIAINPNDPAAIDGDDLADMKVRATEKGFNFPYLQDVGQQVYPQYGATKTPHVFVLQKEGNNNIVRYIGSIDDSSRKPNKVKKRYVEQAVDALLAGKSPSTTTTKAIGCSIKTL